MAHILLVYGTTEGQTRKIAHYAADAFRELGHVATVVDSTDVPSDLDWAATDAVWLLGSIHQGHHQRSLVAFIKDNLTEIDSRPNALLSVSLSAVATDAQGFADAKRCVDVLTEETDWHPQVTELVAGALLYTRYDWFKRMIMKSISKSHGGEVDTTRDHEYTDWDRLARFVYIFAEDNLRIPAPA